VILDPARNPALAEWRLAPLLARRDGAPVARLLAAQPLGGGEAHFGYVAAAEEAGDALAALLERAASWGGGGLVGPLNFSLNHTAGALVAGFAPPFGIETPQNPAWLGPMLERAGCTKLRDLLGYRLDAAALQAAAPPKGVVIERLGFATRPRGAGCPAGRGRRQGARGGLARRRGVLGARGQRADARADAPDRRARAPPLAAVLARGLISLPRSAARARGSARTTWHPRRAHAPPLARGRCPPARSRRRCRAPARPAARARGAPRH
jgi:hypothetical protein